MKERMLFAIVLVLALLVLVGSLLAPPPVQAACPAPGTGYAGALNMLHDPTMWDTMTDHVAPQGNDGMFTAVANSSCDHP